MKRTKKMLALFLAMVMAFSTLVIPAMAAGDDGGIMPRRPVMDCPKCGKSVEYNVSSVKIVDEWLDKCPKLNAPHWHEVTTTLYSYACGHSNPVVYSVCK